MPQTTIIYFDIAAVVVMTISLASLLLRGLTKGAANRVYLTAMVLVTITALSALGTEMCDIVASESALGTNAYYPCTIRNVFVVAYYALLSLAAPAYLVLIATVSDTTHRLNSNNFVRFMLWAPMLIVLLVVISNPIHHLVFAYDGTLSRGPLFPVIYASAAYYTIVGVGWLVRWKALFSSNEFATLILLYPIMLAAVSIQHNVPGLRLEMFVISIAMLLVSAFVIHPETRHDPLIDAESLQSYREMTRRAFITDKPLCLVYAEMVNMEQLQQLAGKDELHEIIRGVAAYLTSRLEGDDVMYYLHNGLFCIAPRNTDFDHALRIAQESHEEGKRKAERRNGTPSATEMRSCIVRVPEDVTDNDTLRNFVKRYSHLVPTSTVTTFQELSKRQDFALQIALADVIAKAIEEQSFEAYYQPIYCLEDNRFHSAEALVRLRDPEYGWVSPMLFVPEAEQNGTIIDIGSILLRKICAFLGSIDYETTSLSYVEVNLSVDQCVRPQMASELLALMDEYGVDPSRINLEITETSSAYSQHAIEDNVRTLAAAGIALSLDDYGDGYSNIARMLSLPFSLIKIDKSFTDALDDADTRTVLSDTVASMKRIGKKVLVEGVETQDQVALLKSMGVDYIQGYYFAKPLPQEDFIPFLQEHNA